VNVFKPEDFESWATIENPTDNPSVSEWCAKRANAIHEERCNGIHLFEEGIKLKKKNARLREFLGSILRQDQLRGYPTGREWEKIVFEIRDALKGSKGENK
jgi:hypothetical protein